MIFSFIVQGPISNWTQHVIDSIHLHFAGSDTIISTWEEERKNFNKLTLRSSVKEVIFSDSQNILKYNNHQNISRSIFSSLEGLKLAKQKYSVKLRSDIMFISDSLIKNFEKYKSRVVFEDKKMFIDKLRIVHWNCHAETKPLYTCDSLCAGLTEDVIKYYDVDLIDKNTKKYSYIFTNPPDYVNMRGYGPNYDIGNEHSLPCLSVKKYLNFMFSNPDSMSNHEKSLNEKIIFENFVMLNASKEFGVKFLKHPNYGINSTNQYYEKVFNKYKIV